MRTNLRTLASSALAVGALLALVGVGFATDGDDADALPSPAETAVTFGTTPCGWECD